MNVDDLIKIHKRIKEKNTIGSLSRLKKIREELQDCLDSAYRPSQSTLFGVKVDGISLNEIELILSLIEAQISELAL